MAISHYPRVNKKSALYCKVETAPGTAETTGMTDSIIVTNLRYTDNTELIARTRGDTEGHLASIIGMRQGQVTFTTEVHGGAAQPAWAAILMPAIGLGYSTTKYLADLLPPTASGATTKTVTLWVNVDGVKHILYGCMGTARFNFVAGQIVTVDWTFTGIPGTPVDEAISAITYQSTTPMRWISSTFTIGSWTPRCESVSIDVGNTVVLLPDGTKASGAAFACISSRLPKVTMNPESSLLAVKDVFADIVASTVAALSLTISDGTNTCTIAGSNLQFLAAPHGDRNGFVTHEIEAQINGGDLAFTFSGA